MLRVYFEKKMGEFTFLPKFPACARDGEFYTVGLYESNALGALVYEWTEDGKEMVSLHSFWSDEQHLKNCLGMNKKQGYVENIYGKEHGGDVLKAVKINTGYKKARKIAELLVEAFDELKIELYTEEQEG